MKRAELARALVVKPDILYMDEPFSALDALMNLRMRNELLRILDEERHTVLLITHDVEEAIYMADRIMVLSPRPTTVQASFEVGLSRPRKLSSPAAQALREDILKELGLSVAKAADILGVRRATLSDLVNGHAALSPEMALRIEKAFGVDMDMLLRMQAWHDGHAMRERADEIQVARYQPSAG